MYSVKLNLYALPRSSLPEWRVILPIHGHPIASHPRLCASITRTAARPLPLTEKQHATTDSIIAADIIDPEYDFRRKEETYNHIFQAPGFPSVEWTYKNTCNALVRSINSTFSSTALRTKISSSIFHHPLQHAYRSTKIYSTKCTAATSDNVNHFSDMELAHGRRLRLSIEQQLSTIDDQVAQLMAKRKPYAASLANLKIALAPHRRMPSEILAQIFDLAMAEKEIVIPARGPIANRLPWILGQVCSSWRQIVLSEHGLWDNVTLVTRMWSKGDRPIARANQFLPRGIASWELKENINQDAFQLDLGKLPFSNLRYLGLTLMLYNLVSALTAIPTSFASLESIEIFSWRTRNEHEPSADLVEELKSTKLFHIAQDVTYLSIRVNGSYLDTFNEAFLKIQNVPWGNLKHFSLFTEITKDAHLDIFSRVLEQCTSLEGLAFTIDERKPIPHTLDLSIVPPQLKELEIEGAYPSEISFPWAQLTQLSLDGARLSAARKILSQAHCLESLSVLGEPAAHWSSDSDDDDNGMPSSPITLDSLLSLSISENYFDVFDHIHSPQLVTLRITQEYRFGDFSLKPIVAFINRCDLHITSFRSNAYFDDEPGTLAEFLRVMASLRRLRARYLLIPDDLLIEIGKGSLLPILGELEIQVKPTMAFANAITSRYEITGWNGLRFARGHYPASCANDSNSAVNVANSIQTFAEFNASYGTNFKLVGTLEEDR